jgi:hypothetical protein
VAVVVERRPAKLPLVRRMATALGPCFGTRTARLWTLAMVALAALGSFHRYYDIAFQIPLGDEWHSLARASTSAFDDLFRYYERATAIPLNLYQRWLLDSYSWSELSIRMVSIVATGATLLLLPWAVLGVTRSRLVAAAVLVLFVVSPFWIFYGQNSRPYAAYLLLLLAVYYFFYRALFSNAPRHWFGFAASGALAVYFHLYALPAVGSLALLVLARLVALFRVDRREALRFLWGSFCGFGGWALLVGALFARSLIAGMSGRVPAGKQPHAFDQLFFRHFAELLTGSRYSWFGWVLIGLSLVGLVSLARKHVWLVATLLIPALACTVFTDLVRPRWYFIAIVFLRYDISFFPLYFLGLARFTERAAALSHRFWRQLVPSASSERWGVGAVVLLGLVTLGASPTPTLLTIQPNNFRQHSAYQEFYSKWDLNRVWENDFFGDIDTRTAGEIPDFYQRFRGRPGNCRLIEFPLALYEYYVPYNFYQRIHGCEVIAGYSSHDDIGGMLNLGEHRSKMKFRRLVDLEQPERVRRKRADYLIVHHNIRQEVEGKKLIKTHRDVAIVLEKLERSFGPPFYTDRHVSVFKP